MISTDPSQGPFTRRTPRVVTAARLHRRREREATGRFLVEGPQAVHEALAQQSAPSTAPRRPSAPRTAVREVFVTAAAAERNLGLVAAARRTGAAISPVTDAALAGLAETVSPQGLVGVCDHVDVPLATALAARPRLVAVLVEIRDPGNAGTVLRTADAAGAQVVVFAGAAVDPYNGKCVRASAGSLFHVDLVRSPEPPVAALRAAVLRVLAANGHGETDLDDLPDALLAAPTAWLFGSEAHGLPGSLLASADDRVRVPLHGRAESLNLGAAAAVCLYACARAQTRRGPDG